MTAVYCREPITESSESESEVMHLAVNFMRHESGKQVLEVRDAKLAK